MAVGDCWSLLISIRVNNHYQLLLLLLMINSYEALSTLQLKHCIMNGQSLTIAKKVLETADVQQIQATPSPVGSSRDRAQIRRVQLGGWL